MSQAGLLDIEASHPQIATSFTTDAGTAIPLANNLEILGGDGISTSASGKTITCALDNPVAVSLGGTGRASLTAGSVILGNGTSAVDSIGLTNGQLLIGDTAGVTPVASTLTEGTGVSILNEAGSITLSASSSVAINFDADAGSALPALNVITMAGNATQGISSSGAGSTITYTIADAAEGQKGVGETATNVEAIAAAATDKFLVPSNMTSLFAAPPAIGGTTPSTGKLTYLDLVSGAAPAHAAGRLFFDSTTDSLSVYNSEADVTLQIGEENWIKVRNETGSTITNGNIIYLSGASGGLPLITKAQANADLSQRALGVVTHDIETASNGFVTTFGLVRGLNTGAFVGGDIIYLSPTSAGGVTTTKPDNTDWITRIGYIANASAAPDGTFLVTIENSGNIEDLHGYTNNPNGFEDPTNDAQISFVNGTRTFTVEPQATEFRYWSDGILYEKTSGEDIIIPDTEGMHFIYYDGSTLSQTTTFVETLITEYALVTAIYWDATNNEQIYMGDEFFHTSKMESRTHLYLHDIVGFALESGGALTDILVDQTGATDNHAQFGNEASEAHDEDAEFTFTSRGSTDTVYFLYKEGASAEWRLDDDANFGVITTGTGRAAYNENNGGTWQQTEITNNRYLLAHAFTFNDSTRKFGVIQGENEYLNVNDARDGANVEVSAITLAGVPSAEMKFLGTVIYQTSDGYGNTVKSRIRSTDTGDDYVDLRDAQITRGGVSGSLTDHGALTGLADDDHPQYLLADGTRALAGAWDMGSQILTNVNIDSGVITGITDLLVADGGTGRGTATAYSVICGGTTATAAHQSVASVGTAGQVLTSTGAGSLPTFQAPTAATDVSDATFRIQDDGDPTKEIAFEASTVGAGTVKTITMPNANVDLTANTGTFAAAAGGTQIVTLGTIATGVWNGTDIAVPDGGTGASTLTDGGILLGSGAGAITATAQPTNGQLLVGSTGVDPVLATLTGTANQITVTDGAGSVTLSTPQDIATSSTVEFAKLGIGTATVPHGAIGSCLVALDGTNASTAGPHMQFTTVSDDYPVMQILPWSHDNVNIIFDGYRDSGGQKSSSANGSFKIKKALSTLEISGETGIAAGSAATYDNIIIFNANGYVTMPLQPLVLAYNSSVDSNVTGDGTDFTLIFDTEVTDRNNNWDGTSTFTAPVTGNYDTELACHLDDLAAANDMVLRLITSNRGYRMSQMGGASADGGGELNMNGSVMADMDAADTMTATILASGGTKIVDVEGTFSSQPTTKISIRLV